MAPTPLPRFLLQSSNSNKFTASHFLQFFTKFSLLLYGSPNSRHRRSTTAGKKMPPCVAGVCAPISSPVPEADSPLISPPADALSPDSSPIASEPPPADFPQPIFHQSTSPPPPVLEWKSSSANSVASPVINTFSKSLSLPMAVIAGAVVVGAIFLLVLGIFLICCCCRKKKREQISPNVPPAKDGNHGVQRQYRQPGNPSSSEDPRVSSLPPPPGAGFHFQPSNPSSRSSSAPPDSITSGNSGPSYNGAFSYSKTSFRYEELAKATNGFSDSNFLGQGGFGSVHKGTLEDGREVAIKSLKADSEQGEREFQAEIDVISRVHHKHLVTLVGFCITGSHRMLVYEFVANKTLEFHLYGKGRPTMDWPTRLKIALGAAKGLAYLHEDCHPKIIHRDIKGANILLDSQFETEVADFGLAKITKDANTHVSTRVMGTFGYLAPEYASSGKLIEKSDVFSFGVMLLELITGRRPVDRKRSYMDDSLVEWAMEDGTFEPFVDPKLQNNYSQDEMARMVACASGATSHSARRRPKMSQIVRALDSSTSLSDINSLMAPGENRAFGAYGSVAYSSGQYKEDMKRFRMMVLETQDSASNGYTTGTTKEYTFMQSESSSGISDNQSFSISIAK